MYPRRFGVPRTDVERVMQHYGVSREEAERMIREQGVERLLPPRGTGYLDYRMAKAMTFQTNWGSLLVIGALILGFIYFTRK